jgi:hypothetical protein
MIGSRAYIQQLEMDHCCVDMSPNLFYCSKTLLTTRL